ncbi:terpene cyclase/mutase family protein [Nocardia zapadnayensis]|uniref:prenyltransferase/squalene oxidase repeat-containing protein n=1 Tax=Nocardia rhamnosiphila TaxID=426716 RepID=UPI0022464C96|nr:prenyltransferase/squalene oxidase repeat-containing protein [Nocardia zapadnayensis]MCX0272542.1 terpene cyclase/mutase family protein [Nocardia zapadnayensis]
MLSDYFANRSLPVERVVLDAFEYFRGCYRPDGSVAEDPTVVVFQEWDSVNALKAVALWHNVLSGCSADFTGGVLAFLAGREKPTGMLSWGAAEIGPSEYCTETSSEYISVLALLGYEEKARRKAEFLRDRQLPDGPWQEVHSHIPKAFQSESSVTGFALCALDEAGVEPGYPDEALDFLVGKQDAEGHFGINWYYYCTHYYLMRPAVAALVQFGNYAAAARARDFVVKQQRPDGSWFSRVDGFRGEPSAPELQTALAVMTLAHTGMGVDDPPVRRAVDWLLDRRRADGSWPGGRYPYPETDSYSAFRATQDVYTTAQVLAAFKYLEQQ